MAGTERVVLSACETGVGEVHHGEGVLCLRRALSVAGVRSVVMSLWSVPDTATRLLMEDFYRGLLRRRLGLAEALRRAQLAQLERGRTTERLGHRIRGLRAGWRLGLGGPACRACSSMRPDACGQRDPQPKGVATSAPPMSWMRTLPRAR